MTQPLEIDVTVIALLCTILGTILGIYRVYYTLTKDRERDIQKAFEVTEAKIAAVVRTEEEKREVMWKRIDDLKQLHIIDIEKLRKEYAQEYVQVNLCRIMHNTSDRAMEKIDSKLEQIAVKVEAITNLVMKLQGNIKEEG